MIPAGEMNQRITVQQKVIELNDLNEQIATSFADVCTVWAKVMPLRGNAFFTANQQQHSIDARFWIRDRAGLDTTMRLLWRGQPYDIQGIVPGTERYQGMLEIMAINGVRDGAE
jgi:SPP1 family predicted phage head-tail adaptor